MIEVPTEAVAIVAMVLAIALLALWLIHWSERAPGGGRPLGPTLCAHDGIGRPSSRFGLPCSPSTLSTDPASAARGRRPRAPSFVCVDLAVTHEPATKGTFEVRGELVGLAHRERLMGADR